MEFIYPRYGYQCVDEWVCMHSFYMDKHLHYIFHILWVAVWSITDIEDTTGRVFIVLLYTCT